MKKKKLFCFRLMLGLLFLGVFGKTEVFGAVQEGKPGQTLSGEYAVIINTDTVNPGNTGTLNFDGTAGQSSDSTEGDKNSPIAADETQTLGNTGTLVNSQGTESLLAAAQVATTTYQKGEEKYIYRTNMTGKTYVCIGTGEHCYVWMDKTMKADYDAAGKTDLIAADMAAVYDGQPYRILNQLCRGDFPSQDGSGKLSILLETLNGASGVFQNDVDITAIHINTPAPASYVSGEMSKRNGLLVHEGQHALLWLKTKFMNSGRYMWLNEGLAVAAMDYLWGGTDSSNWMSGIGSNATIRSGSSLIYQTYRNDNDQDYGMPYLFVRYLIDRMAGSYQPMQVLPRFYTIDASSLSSEQYLEKVTGISFKELMSDFYTAVAAGERTGKYSFYGDTIAAEKAAAFPVYAGDNNKDHTLPPASAILVKLANGSFTVPTDGSSGIIYRIIGDKKSSLAPAVGDGTSAHPYEISSFDDLNLIQANQGACYRLTNNIEANGRTNFSVSYFSGTLDGGGYTITGLTKPLIQQNAGTIRNLNIVADFDYDSHDIQGIIAQYNTQNIQNCKVTGTVTGHMGATSSMSHPTFGGIVGENEVAGTISECSSNLQLSLSMTATDSFTGGIAGVNTGTVEKCVAGGNLSVTQANGDSYKVYLGGITGKIQTFSMGGNIKQCAFTGSLKVNGGTGVIGQICSLADDSVLNSYTKLDGHVTDCYGKSGQGELIGEAKGQTLTTGGTLTAEQMKDQNSYKGWSFDGDWKISDDGLPERSDGSDIRTLAVTGALSEYYVGEDFPTNFGYLIINGSTSNSIPITHDMITGFDTSTPGTKELTISYKGKNTTFSLAVKEPSASDIASIVLGGVKKTSYTEGQKFDPSGAYLWANIGNRYAYIYSGFSYDKKDPLKASDTKVTFNYFGKEASVNITVKARTVSKLSLLTAPSKTQYTAGAPLDLSGAKLQLTYNDGTQTPVFKADEMEQYNVHAAFGKNSTFTAVSRNKILTGEDDGSTLVFYVGDVLPSSYGAVAVTASQISVKAPLSISGLDLYVSAGNTEEQYVSTENVTGGSGSYTTTVISENLPAGMSRNYLPGEYWYLFGYHGVVTAGVGDYSSKYEIRDTNTQESIQVTVTIHVVPSNEARFFSFVLNKAMNPGLKTDIAGEIGENTIILRVPKGTNVTALKPSVEFGYSLGTRLPDAYVNGTSHDFTNPVVYTLTAPDGVTKKSYTVSVVFYDDTTGGAQRGGEILSPADNTRISCKDSETVEIKGWAADSSKEISSFKYVINGKSYMIPASSTDQTIPNAKAYETRLLGSSLNEGNNTLEIWVTYSDISGTGSGNTTEKLGTRTIIKAGHQIVKDAAVAATCDKAGKTEGSHCSVCNTVLKAQTTIPALGHNWDSGKVTKAATCTTTGVKTYTCSRCGATKTESIPAAGHKEVKDAAVAATCDKAGKTEGSHCSVCNTVIKAQTTIPALGHSWDNGKVTKAATCTTTGVKTYTCSRCGATKTENIPATGHKEVKDAAVAATCDKAGKTEGSHCSVCNTVLKAQTTIPALGHNWDSGKVTKAATCTATGVKTYTCSRCGATKTESIPALGHDYGQWKVIKAATYTEPGQEERVCRRDAAHKEYRQIPVLEKVLINISDCTITLSDQTYVYDGTEKKPAVTLTYNGKTLTEDKDYQIYYADNVNPGTAKITIMAKTDSDYKGTAAATFEIRKALPENATVIQPGAFSNCANLVNLNIRGTVTQIGDNAFADSKNLHNIYFYGNCPKLGNNIFKNVTATAYYPYADKTWSLDVLQNYGGNITWVPWNPETKSPAKRSLSLCDIRISTEKYTYDGTEKKPEAVITDGKYTLRKDIDYTIKYSNNINAGNAELEITGTGNYSGTGRNGFIIEPAVPELGFEKTEINVNYGTKPFSAALTKKVTDGAVTYTSSNTKTAVIDPATGQITVKGVGTATITATAAKSNNYQAGAVSCTLKVTKKNNTIKASNIRRVTSTKARKISINAKVSGKAALKYTSGSKTVKVDSKGRITIPARFTGSVKITIRSSATAIYNAAKKTITVTVNPSGTALTAAKNTTGRKAAVSWKKNRYVTGYEVQYSVNKNFRSAGKKTISKASTTKCTLTNLKKNKTYYVRIRTYKKSGTKKYYSSWSKVKTVRIRK